VALELVELAQSDRRVNVGEVRLEARDADVVERAVPAAHEPVLADRVGEAVVVRRDHSPFAGGDVLRRVEREARGVRDRANLAAAVLGLDGVGRVLDDRDPGRQERVEIRGLTGEVDGHDRLRARRDRLDRERRVDVEVLVAHVDEDGPRAEMDGDVAGGRPRDRRRDDLVAGTDAEPREREVQRGGARCERDAVLCARQLRDSLLELCRPGAAREPAALQRLGDSGDLLRPDRRRLERKE
jgi:hypothetical protein